MFYRSTFLVYLALPFSFGVILQNHCTFPQVAYQNVLPSDSDTCDLPQFRKCSQDLAKRLGLTEMPRSEAAFAEVIESILQKQGEPGFIQICKGNTVYKECVGPTYDDCITADNLQQNIKLNQSDALAYSSLALVMDYECGPAYTVIIAQWPCLIAMTSAQAQTLQGCANQYTKNVIADPTNVCKYTQDYVDCYTNAMNGCGADLELALCNALRVAFSVSLPQCDINCSVI